MAVAVPIYCLDKEPVLLVRPLPIHLLVRVNNSEASLL